MACESLSSCVAVKVTDVVLNNLYKQTALQSVFGINMVALHDGQPKLLNLKQILEAFMSHRREVVAPGERFSNCERHAIARTSWKGSRWRLRISTMLSS